MATVDDWTLLQSGSLLGDKMVPDETTYAPELLRQYQAITGVDIFKGESQDFKPGSYEQWSSYGIGDITQSSYKALSTEENLAKLGYTAPLMSQEDVINRDLAGGEYADYKSSYSGDVTQAYEDRYSELNAELATIGDSTSGVDAFVARNPGISISTSIYGRDYGYSLNPSYATGYQSQGVTDANAKILGVETGTAKSVNDYYSEKYGTEFSREQIDTALTGKYGELQNAGNMGAGWMELYQTYDKWQQEDQMWKTEMLGLQNELFPAAEAQQRASMAAGGMKAGSDQWNTAIQGIQNQRIDVESKLAEKEAALEDTSVYKSLMNQYNELKGTAESRGIEKTATEYRDVSTYVEASDKYVGATYGIDSETGQQIVINPGYWNSIPSHYEISSKPFEYTYVEGTETGRLLYGADEDKSVEPTFDEFYQTQFGTAGGVENPYTSVGTLSNQEESPEDRRARISASGASMEQ